MRAAASLALVSATAAVVGYFRSPGDTGDLRYFVHAAERMLSADWASTYADRDLQVGPLQLLVFGLVGDERLIGAAVGALVAALFWLVARRLIGRTGWAVFIASLAPIALSLTFDAYRDGHPAQVIVPLLWVLAGLEIRSGRAWQAGALVGLSAGFELWGALGLVVIMLAPRIGAAVRAVAASGLVVALMFAPFLLAGDFAMFEYRWQVNGDTLLVLFVEPGTDFAWPLRTLQGAASLAAGCVVAWFLRQSPAALWAAPLAVVTVRLALDPVRYPWYWLALQTLVLVGAVQLAATRLVREAHPGPARPLPAVPAAARRSARGTCLRRFRDSRARAVPGRP